MVALNEKFSHSGLPASEGRVSPHEIDAFDFTKWSGEVWGGSVVNFGGAGFRGLSDASPLRRHSAAPVNRSDPESELHYVRNRTYSPALCTVLRRGLKSSGRPGRASKKIAVLQWIQRGPIGYSGGINLYEYVGGRAVVAVDPAGLAYLYRVGPAHDLGGCGSTCRFYRNYYYYQPLGEWDLPESPNSAALTEFAHAVFTLSGAGRLVNVLMSGVTISTPEYAYFFWLTWKDTRVFTYRCHTHYSGVRWESTVRHKDLRVHYKSVSQWGLTGNNLVIPGQGTTLKDIGHNITDLVMEIIHAVEGAE